jgi:crotonobetainyl-CoA:carnitine CoA-transferase CaiB-like acyl-CoA transferase
VSALDSIRVFDLTRVLAGPLCTQILGDLGADVIKVEQPGVGDITRTWGPPFDAENVSAYYLSCNRNKRSMTLDFTKPEGLEIAYKLIAKSDVFVENFMVGQLSKYGLGYEDVKKINPNIIYCSVTGFGQTGPYAKRPGYDFQIQGMSGLMSLVGEEGGGPLRAGISISDISTGIYSALAIVTALYQRSQTGEGQYIDMSLLDSTMALMTFAAQSYLVDSKQPPRVGNGHPNIVPYGAFKARDGFIIVAIGTEEQFQKFCKFVEHEDLCSNPLFNSNKERVKNRESMNQEMSNIIGKETVAYWSENLEAIGIPAGPVNSIEEAFNDQQVKARSIEKMIEGMKTVASPLGLSKSRPVYRRKPPHLGEHGEEILKEL